MKYRSVVVTRKGGPEVLQVVESELRPPKPGEVRVKVLASCVGRTDIGYRRGELAFAPRIPFVPGYEILGSVDAIGEGVTGFAAGDRVAALTGHGGNAEYIYLGREHLAHVPASLDPAEAVTLILNFATAYQMLHRTAKVRSGETALVIGASGGVGTALLQLGKLAGLELFGTASPSKHKVLMTLGAFPIDYHSQDFVEVIRRAKLEGLDFVFDGMGGEYSARGRRLLRRGGKLVVFAAARGVSEVLVGALKMTWANLQPHGRSVASFGISALYRMDKRPFMEDLGVLFQLLEEGKIKPIIARKFPLLEAARAHELLESGEVVGNLVLLAPELT